MPKEMERQLKAKAASKGMSGKQADRSVYGSMRKTGWKPSHQKGTGGAGGSPVKFIKREGSLE